MKRIGIILLILWFVPGSLLAKDRGPVTNLPMPRFVSLKATEANARRGPSLSHRIDWVFKRKQMPLEIFAEYGNWRRVRDIDGAGGWVHYSLLSGVRSVIIILDMQPMFARPDPESLVVARFEKSALANLEKCTREWCHLRAGGYKGWVPKGKLWGVYKDEIKE